MLITVSIDGTIKLWEAGMDRRVLDVGYFLFCNLAVFEPAPRNFWRNIILECLTISIEFDAFISYRRSDGRNAARCLRQALINYRLPRSLCAEGDGKLKVFLDTVYERGANDFYEKTIAPALRHSHWLVFIATADSVRANDESDWVQRELNDFRSGPNPENIIVARAHGEFDVPLPSFFRVHMPNAQIVDIRAFEKGPFKRFLIRHTLADEVLKVAGPLHGIQLKDMPTLRKEEAKRKLRRIAATGAVLLLVFVGVSWSAWNWWQADRMASLERADRWITKAQFLMAEGHITDSTKLLLAARRDFEKLDETRLPTVDSSLRRAVPMLREQARWHTDGSDGIAISKDATKLIIDHGYEEGIRVYDRQSGVQLSPSHQYNDIWNIFFRGKTALAARETDQGFVLYDLERNEPISKPVRLRSSIRQVVNTDDGRWLTILDVDSAFTIDTETGKVVGNPIEGLETVEELHLAGDGSRILILRDDKAELFDTETGTQISGPFDGGPIYASSPLASTSSSVRKAHFVGNGNLFVVAGWYAVHLRRSSDGKPTLRSEQLNSNAVPNPLTKLQQALQHLMPIAKNEDHQRAVESLLLVHSERLSNVVLSDDAPSLAAQIGSKIVVWKPLLGQSIEIPFRFDNVDSLKFLPDGRRLLVVLKNKIIVLSIPDASQGEGDPTILERLVHQPGRLGKVAIDANGIFLLSSSYDHTVRLWDLRITSQTVFSPANSRQASAAAFGPDENWIALVSSDNTLRRYDLHTNEQLGPTMYHDSSVKAIFVSIDGSMLVSGGRDQTIRFWNVSDHSPARPPLLLQNAIEFLVAGPRGKLFLSVTRNRTTQNRTIQLRKLETGAAIGPPLELSSRINDIKFSPDGLHYLILSDGSKELRVVLADASGLTETLDLEGRRLQLASFSSDSRFVHAVDRYRENRRWSINRRRFEKFIDDAEHTPHAVLLTRDGKYFASLHLDADFRDIFSVYTITRNGSEQLYSGLAPIRISRSYEAFAISGGRRFIAMTIPSGLLLIDLFKATETRLTLPPIGFKIQQFDLIFSSDEKRLLVKTSKALIAYETESGMQVRGSFMTFQRRWPKMRMSPYGRFAILSSVTDTRLVAIPEATGGSLLSRACLALGRNTTLSATLLKTKQSDTVCDDNQ